MFANHPPDTVDNIAFATAIGPNYASNTFVKMQYGFISKTFKTFYFKTL